MSATANAVALRRFRWALDADGRAFLLARLKSRRARQRRTASANASAAKGRSAALTPNDIAIFAARAYRPEATEREIALRAGVGARTVSRWAAAFGELKLPTEADAHADPHGLAIYCFAEHEDVDAVARIVAAYVVTHESAAVGCYASARTIAEATGLSARSVERGCAYLVERGWITSTMLRRGDLLAGAIVKAPQLAVRRFVKEAVIASAKAYTAKAKASGTSDRPDGDLAKQTVTGRSPSGRPQPAKEAAKISPSGRSDLANEAEDLTLETTKITQPHPPALAEKRTAEGGVGVVVDSMREKIEAKKSGSDHRGAESETAKVERVVAAIEASRSYFAALEIGEKGRRTIRSRLRMVDGDADALIEAFAELKRRGGASDTRYVGALPIKTAEDIRELATAKANREAAHALRLEKERLDTEAREREREARRVADDRRRKLADLRRTWPELDPIDDVELRRYDYADRLACLGLADSRSLLSPKMASEQGWLKPADPSLVAEALEKRSAEVAPQGTREQRAEKCARWAASLLGLIESAAFTNDACFGLRARMLDELRELGASPPGPPPHGPNRPRHRDGSPDRPRSSLATGEVAPSTAAPLGPADAADVAATISAVAKIERLALAFAESIPDADARARRLRPVLRRLEQAANAVLATPAPDVDRADTQFAAAGVAFERLVDFVLIDGPPTSSLAERVEHARCIRAPHRQTEAA